MLQNSEIAPLTGLVTRTHGTLHGISSQFSSMFKGSLNIYSAISLLCDFLGNNILEGRQRISALYIILINYSSETPENHPFIETLLKISEETQQPLERKMIYELLIKNNFDNYSGFQLQNFDDLAGKQNEMPQQREQILNLKERIKDKFRKMKLNASSAADTIKIAKIQEGEQKKFEQQVLDIPIIRPCPDFLEIKASEFHWLSPGIISDVEWDNTYEIDKKMEKARKIFFSALNKNLEPKQRNELLSCIDTDAYAPLYLGMKPQHVRKLLSFNHFVAVSLIIKLSKYGQIQDYLQILLFENTSVSLIDTIGRIIKQVRLPEPYIILFLVKHLNQTVKMAVQSEQRLILAYTLTAFLRCMVENEQINPLEIKAQISSFMGEFQKNIDFNSVRTCLEKK